MNDGGAPTVNDVERFCQLVEQGRVGVAWSVSPEFGPEHIGSRREVTFFVDSTPVTASALTERLARILIDGLQIPATSRDHLISGEGDLRRQEYSVEIVYDWQRTIPFDEPVENGSGVFTLIEMDDKWNLKRMKRCGSSANSAPN